MTSILVTGGCGFVGSAIALMFHDSGFKVRISSRRNSVFAPSGIEVVRVPDLSIHTDWSSALAGIDVVVHCAGRAHIFDGHGGNSDSLFHIINVEGTQNLAAQASAAGVRRFIFLSSVGVTGCKTNIPDSISELSPADPYNSYTKSKLDAEDALLSLIKKTLMDIVIVRPPIVYGPGAPGNFYSLLWLIKLRIPLPLKSIKNKRSFISIENLCNFILVCAFHRNASNQIFLISDGSDLSTPELIDRLADLMGVKSPLFPFPLFLLKLFLLLIGKKYLIDKLSQSLQIDITKARILLEWTPPISVDLGIKGILKNKDLI
jgi:nucleoside-diphosphate-sugar epimerase